MCVAFYSTVFVGSFFSFLNCFESNNFMHFSMSSFLSKITTPWPLSCLIRMISLFLLFLTLEQLHMKQQNQLTGFYIIATLAFKALIKRLESFSVVWNCHVRYHVQKNLNKY